MFLIMGSFFIMSISAWYALKRRHLEFARRSFIGGLLLATPAGDLVRPILAADKALITEARIFDVYQGPGVPAGSKSVAVEVRV